MRIGYAQVSTDEQHLQLPPYRGSGSCEVLSRLPSRYPWNSARLKRFPSGSEAMLRDCPFSAS